jgi:hypothetical protein
MLSWGGLLVSQFLLGVVTVRRLVHLRLQLLRVALMVILAVHLVRLQGLMVVPLPAPLAMLLALPLHLPVHQRSAVPLLDPLVLKTLT